MSIDNSTLQQLLVEYAGNIKKTAKGFQIRCPWHDDINPSCVVLSKTGVFYCFVCHGDQPKGHRGASPYQGFLKLGMPPQRAKDIFLSATSKKNLDWSNQLPSLSSDVDIKKKSSRPQLSQVIERKAWPQYWGFRNLSYETIISPWFKEKFDPSIVMLRRERYPRLALSVGGSEKFKDTKKETYLHQEVFLRLSSVVKAKVINTKNLNLDPDVLDPYPASLFGLVNNKLSDKCRGLILVEGPYDGLNILQSIHRKLDGAFEVISLLGTPQFENCFKQLEKYILPYLIQKGIPIVLAFDNDNAGFKLTKTAVLSLRDRGLVPSHLLKVLTYPTKDPGDLNDDVFVSCLSKVFGDNL